MDGQVKIALRHGIAPAVQAACGPTVLVVNIPQLIRTALKISPPLHPVIKYRVGLGVGQIPGQHMGKHDLTDLHIGQRAQLSDLGKTDKTVSGDAVSADRREGKGHSACLLPQLPLRGLQRSLTRLDMAAGDLPGGALLVAAKDPLVLIVRHDHGKCHLIIVDLTQSIVPGRQIRLALHICSLPYCLIIPH